MTTFAMQPSTYPAYSANRNNGVGRILASATTEVMIMSGRSTTRGSAALVHRVEPSHVRRGPRYRILAPATDPSSALISLAVAGAEVRTAAGMLTDAIVIDNAVAVLPAGATPSGDVAVFRLPSVVATTTELFERVWASAVPLAESGELGPREREVLALLSFGHTDAAVAVRLGVSVRTVRRMVADIMDRLGARSRFEAGAKAAERRWLLENAS